MSGGSLSSKLMVCFPVADFEYITFDDTSGLKFVGSAATTSCGVNSPVRIQPLHPSCYL